MNLYATALAVEQRGGAIFLQQWVSRSRGGVLLPERKADLWDERLGPLQTSTGTFKSLVWRKRFGDVCSCHGFIILCFVFSLQVKEKSQVIFKSCLDRINITSEGGLYIYAAVL